MIPQHLGGRAFDDQEDQAGTSNISTMAKTCRKCCLLSRRIRKQGSTLLAKVGTSFPGTPARRTGFETASQYPVQSGLDRLAGPYAGAKRTRAQMPKDRLRTAVRSL